MSTFGKGRRGEELTRAYLERNGYEILECNYRAFGAEIDIVARFGDTIVFADVKNWDAYGFGEMRQALNMSKMRRIIRASNGYLNSHKCFTGYGVRYDVVFLTGAGKIMEHIEDAFTETGAL